MYLCTKFSKRFAVIYPTGLIAHFETSKTDYISA